MKRPKVEVYCDINSKTIDHPRYRVLVFMHEGTSMQLTQKLVKWFGGGVGYIDYIETPPSVQLDPEWADSLIVVLEHIKWFIAKSRPHWEKYATDHRCNHERPDIEIDVTIGSSPKVFAEVDEKENELARAIVLAVDSVVGSSCDIKLGYFVNQHR
jgi:hypothetical protein